MSLERTDKTVVLTPALVWFFALSGEISKAIELPSTMKIQEGAAPAKTSGELVVPGRKKFPGLVFQFISSILF